ncbi:exo-beta-N-acetylmuramidase NamZ family protein [Namhaeicola litoreus]|uniref:Exo-beta-N-acetylmuramidase NamZ domain-containing protein n=1 Tax=Namhaeicola litoreus TaxID=1052145 RepID=A0ABW3Y7B3_9FLAO
MKFKSTYLILVKTFSFFLFGLIILSCKSPAKSDDIALDGISKDKIELKEIVVGANRTERYLPLLKGKKVGVVANQTSVVFRPDGTYSHVVDTLLSSGIEVVKVFAPEHGFRGEADAGEHVANDVDLKTGLPIFSLFGKNKKPSQSSLEGIDIVLFDIQDVGVRFYTYISTLTYVMEACAEKGIAVVVLDRPNPNAHYIDGPTLELEHRSFVGMHPIPLVYGMTMAEYAKMVNGEKWLDNEIQCKLDVVEMLNYTYQNNYSLPLRPSPNLPNDQSINLYPSLGFFEGTIINAGRGTDFQFQRYGAPFFPKSEFSYRPKPNFGSKHPKFENESCYGVDLSKVEKLNFVNISYLIDAYQKTPKKDEFFGDSFTIHAGTEKLREQIEAGLSAEEIRKSWQKDIEKFKLIRNKYLIYK